MSNRALNLAVSGLAGMLLYASIKWLSSRSQCRSSCTQCLGSVCDEEFVRAAEFFGRNSDCFTADIQLELYSLFKQATSGDCKELEPEAPTYPFATKRHLMIGAWRSKKGVSSQDAQEAYVTTLEKYCPKWRENIATCISDDEEDIEHDGASGWGACSLPVQPLGEAGTEDDSIRGQVCELAANGNILALKQVIAKDKVLVHSRDVDGMTPLHWASDRGHLDVVGLLLASGADVNAQDLCGNTPLHIAAMANQKEVVRLLIDSKSDLTLENADGENAAHVIKRELPKLVLA